MYIKVKVKTGARRQSVVDMGGGKYEISVKEKPARNAANDRVLALLSLALRVPAKAIRFVSGQRTTTKLFMLR